MVSVEAVLTGKALGKGEVLTGEEGMDWDGAALGGTKVDGAAAEGVGGGTLGFFSFVTLRGLGLGAAFLDGFGVP